MIYKPFQELQLSSLGFGAMRMTGSASGWGGPIHQSAADMIDYAYQHGVNYFDTSYFYHGGESERFLGETLKRYPRDSWFLASKMPGNMFQYDQGAIVVSGKRFANAAELFQFQLDRCQVDHFDFYMLHNLSEGTYDAFTDERYKIIECLVEEKAKGRIRHLGFSSHGRHDTIDRFLTEMKGQGCHDFEFCMIQLNYFDKFLQEAERKHQVITDHGLAVFVMEPLRGGSLTRLGSESIALLKAARPEDSLAAWAFRYTQTLANVPVVLSGMSNIEQVKENVALFSRHDPLSETEVALLQQVVELNADLVPCTSCGYCVDDCPSGLQIPMLLTLHNEVKFAMGWYTEAAIKSLKTSEHPAACTGCGRCVPLCPQNIDIPASLKAFSSKLN